MLKNWMSAFLTNFDNFFNSKILNFHTVYLVWGVYLLLIQNFGYFYNFKFLDHLFLPLLLISVLCLFKQVSSFINQAWKESDKSLRFLLLVTTITVIYTFKISFFYPDYSWDGQAYHLPSSVEWSKSAEINLVSVSLYSSTYPGLSELLQALWFRTTNLFGPPHNISQLLGLLILGAGIVGIGRRLNWPVSSQALSVLFVLTIPNILLQSTTAYNDLFFNSLIVAGIYFALSYAKSDKKEQQVNLFCLGTTAGLVASTKFTGAYFAFALFLLTLILAFHRKNKNFKYFIPSVIFGIAICFPWYLRNFLNFGNPFYPLSVGFGNLTIFKGSIGTPDKAFFDYFAEKAGVENSPMGVVRSWFWWPIQHPVYDTRVGGSGIAWLGITFLTFVILFLVIVLSRKILRKLSSVEIVILVFVIMSVFIVPAGWWPRYVLFFPIITGAVMINLIVSNFPKFQKLIIVFIGITCIESMFYLSFYAGSPTQSYLFNQDQTLLEKSLKSTVKTFIQVKRENVYTLVSPELAPLSNIPPANVYISDPGQQYFPLYGLNFQNRVFPAFNRDVEPKVKINSLKELTTLMNQDGRISVFVTRNLDTYTSFTKENLSCKSLTLQNSKTFIASCK